MEHVTYEIEDDGRTVWINDSTGCCVARFSNFGIDIHKDYEGQMSGKPCLDCKPGPMKLEDWKYFQEKMKDYYGIIVSDKHQPHFLKEPKICAN